jgi:hypothetical protein
LITDEALDYWGEIYVAQDINRRGVLFDAFLQAPEEILDAIARQRAAIAAMPVNVTAISQARRARQLCTRCGAGREMPR